IVHDQIEDNSVFDLTAGLISALFEFARNINKKIEVLEFRPKKDKEVNKVNDEKVKDYGDVLITAQTETFLLHKSVREKIKLIYNNYIHSKIPLDAANHIHENEEKKIIEILTDKKAREKVSKHRNELKR
ncbi:MAG: hypothetical protein ACFFDF_09625, partial [Candidatus Odinarchaeota archaeon]